ncbi:hypothetical protein F5X96DRAFT_665874 [Biscogniauxia mediterranea]|nr:hypothetical protein F5X96DRAFT_665874 [Biscogniauxia mediterranea]
MAWLRLYPKPYPGMPYNEASANRITGDMSVIKEKDESSNALFPITTRKLGTPIAQLLFPGFRKPLVILEDPSRNLGHFGVPQQGVRQSSHGPGHVLAPMFPRASICRYTTPELRAQKRLCVDVMGVDCLRKAAAPNIYKATIELIELWRLKASTIYKDRTFSIYEDQGCRPGRHLGRSGRRGAGRHERHNSPETPTTRRRSGPGNSRTYTPRYRKFRSTVTAEIGQGDETGPSREIPAS